MSVSDRWGEVCELTSLLVVWESPLPLSLVRLVSGVQDYQARVAVCQDLQGAGMPSRLQKAMAPVESGLGRVLSSSPGMRPGCSMLVIEMRRRRGR